MKLIDTHCHLYLEAFEADRENLINEALASGIDTILLPNVDTTTIDAMHQLCARHPGFAYPMMGLHPTSVNKEYPAQLKEIENRLTQRSYCAIGEIGIDLYWDKTFLREQKEVLEKQLQWSIELSLPVAIHTRDAFPEVFECIDKTGADKLKGVFHSFSGTKNDLDKIKQLKNFKLGVSGVVTFKNSGLADVLQQATIDDIVLETDAPYLSPVPFRGKRNEPAFIWKTAEKIAAIYDATIEEVALITRRNALELFMNGATKPSNGIKT
ncbi:MAG: TatD family hydrolase [Tannerellaceae bacterium]|jgi:TatD DNase family protein|nr:TatD family hydrolase [Tannerellaceae bacterium]